MADDDTARALIDHYQQTFELVQKYIKERNRIFLIMVGLIGVAVLLTYRNDTHSLLVDLIGHLLDVETSRRRDLQASFPFGLFQSTLLVAVFYLMVNLYHRSVHILRHYHYLGDLEKEIRPQLHLESTAIAFTRESTYYWSQRPLFLGSIKWVYALLLGALLAIFVAGRIFYDIKVSWLLATADLVLSIPSILFYIAYAATTLSLDTPSGTFAGRSRKPKQAA